MYRHKLEKSGQVSKGRPDGAKILLPSRHESNDSLTLIPEIAHIFVMLQSTSPKAVISDQDIRLTHYRDARAG
jgi:hypothetical protein